tara:strand:+ start:323 stop:943 length:621 start_codon:yes stop_codon:yes gene_type:complete
MINIRYANSNDVDQVTQIHRHIFKNLFMTNMGSLFIKNYYKLILKYSGGYLLIIENNNNEIYGFLCAVKNPSNFYKLLRKHVFILALSALINIALKPSLIIQSIYNFFKTKNKKLRPSSDILEENTFEITSIGVAINHQKKGCSKKLIHYLLKTVKEKVSGKQLVYLYCDLNNDRAHNLYQSIGFKEGFRFNQYNHRQMICYIMEQ